MKDFLLRQHGIIGAIMIGLVLVAGAVVFTEQSSSGAGYQLQRPSKDAIMYGNPKAKTTIVEFSDFECPFCARLHPTLKQLVDQSDGAINWEYRHLPLPIHAYAETSAKISECVHVLGGDTVFWEYAAAILEQQKDFSEVFLLNEAIALGVDETKLSSCLADPKIAALVAEDAATAQAFGGNGTPFSIIVYPDGSTRPVSGALPYENWQAILTP